jgi:Chalcone isomerase-like
MKPIIRKSLIGLAVACLSINPGLFAKEVGGLSIPDSIKLGPESTELVLNGAGVRIKYFQKIYVAGLYLPKRANSENEILAMPGYKRLSMHFIYREVDKDKVVAAWNEGLENNQDPASLASLRQRLEAFNQYFDTMHQGDEVLLDYYPDEGTKVTVKGEYKGAIAGEDFYKALIEVWIGRDPVDSDLKEALLGGG